MAPQQDQGSIRFNLRRLQETCLNRQHNRPRNLVRRMATLPKEDHSRVHQLDLNRRFLAHFGLTVVEHHSDVHKQNRREHFPNGAFRTGEERPILLARKVAHALIHSTHD